VDDAIRCLGMQNEYRYKSSFNRPNLRYDVRKKDGKTIDAIADYVATRPRDSGVVYCLSRKDCEKLAEKLQEQVRKRPNCSRVRVSYYHADLDAHERERRHRDWSNGIVSVLCATIAVRRTLVVGCGSCHRCPLPQSLFIAFVFHPSVRHGYR